MRWGGYFLAPTSWFALWEVALDRQDLSIDSATFWTWCTRTALREHCKKYGLFVPQFGMNQQDKIEMRKKQGPNLIEFAMDCTISSPATQIDTITEGEFGKDVSDDTEIDTNEDADATTKRVRDASSESMQASKRQKTNETSESMRASKRQKTNEEKRDKYADLRR